MKITRIEIKKYKSIKEPIEINFYDNLPTVLIGKNGSGKTNILEALDTIAEVNSNYFGASSKLPLSYKVHITLSKNDIARLFPGKKLMRINAALSPVPVKIAKSTELNRNI